MMTREAEARNGGTTLHPELLSEMEEILKRRKASLVDDVLGLERSRTDNSEMVPAHSSHMAESGTDAFEEELRLARMESAGDEIFEIEEALRRIREGTYGTCEACAAALPVGRLRAIPYARLCLACKVAEEAP
jgi:RNA polymerase-binding transcription factor DksA